MFRFIKKKTCLLAHSAKRERRDLFIARFTVIFLFTSDIYLYSSCTYLSYLYYYYNYRRHLHDHDPYQYDYNHDNHQHPDPNCVDLRGVQQHHHYHNH